MKIFYRSIELKNYLEENKIKSLGFVPTMGTLHQGHLSLVRAASEENSVSLCSIFVNPTQFNQEKDFEKYPKNIQKDISLLVGSGCGICFAPSEEEIYPEGRKLLTISLGNLDKVMEGASRPGHFLGVASVVKRLLRLVSPCQAYFGEKDFQQVLIIEKLIRQWAFPVQIIRMPTIREEGGLAMSSRNLRLSTQERKQAELIYRCLEKAKDLFFQNSKFDEIHNQLKDSFYGSNLTLEYFSIVEEDTLSPIELFNKKKKCRAFIAATINEVRLIDNLAFY